MRDEEVYQSNLNVLTPILSQDSEVEKIFYRKCRQEEKYIGLLLEWVNEKVIYTRYTRMTAYSHGNYSRHDSTHSVAILESIVAVMGRERIAERMGVMDLWLLLHCAYSHDMGMLYSQKEVETLWTNIYQKSEDDFTRFYQECLESNDEDLRSAAEYIKDLGDKLGCNGEEAKKRVKKLETEAEWLAKVCKYHRYLVAEYCRKTHAKRVERMLNEKTELEIYTSSFAVASRLYRYVNECGRAHGEDFEWLMNIPDREWTQQGYCYPRFIAALLRLGDLLDIDNDRFDSVVLKYYGDIPKISEIHKKKHEAITHIDLSETKISITAESDDEDVCKCANEWFTYLNEEVENLIFQWNRIVPESFGGCLLGRPETHILYKGKEYRGRKNGEFIVNKDMLIELVIGKNLYQSQLDFVREYLQNSMDALKMRFWINVSNGEHDHLLNDKTAGEKTVSYTPFDFMEAAFGQYGLKVECEWIEKSKGEIPKIRITITDRGIGIDEECMKAIEHIGSGWKGRRKYKKYLRNMPKWLKPTGGFGIGMQSGFMISDKVEIRTKCDGSNQGKQITLYSSQKSGEIETREIEMQNAGTEVSVDIDYDWFLDTGNFETYDLMQGNVQENEDYFDPEKIMANVEKILGNYISQLFESSLFPIIVKRPRCRALPVIKGNVEKMKFSRWTESDGRKYAVYEYDDSSKGEETKGHILSENLMIWETGAENLYRITAKKDREESELKWFYKGVKVRREPSEEENVWIDIIGTVLIDIMGVDVKGCLKVDRSEFAEEYDSSKHFQRFVKVYFQLYDTMAALIGVKKVTKADMLQIGKKGYFRLLMAYHFGSALLKKDIKKQISSLLPGTEREEENNRETLTETDFLSGDFMVAAWERKENEWRSVQISMWRLCTEICLENAVYSMREEDGVPELSDETDADVKMVICDKKVFTLLSSFRGDNLETKEVNEKIYLIYGRQIFHKKESEELVFADAFDDKSVKEYRQIFRTDEFYKPLFVSRVPWEKNIRKIKSESDKHMIISPVSPMNRNQAIWVKRLKYMEEAEQEFIKIITESKDFEYLVDWVFKHQVEKEKYSREEISDEYKKLLRYLYQGQLARVI